MTTFDLLVAADFLLEGGFDEVARLLRELAEHGHLPDTDFFIGIRTTTENRDTTHIIVVAQRQEPMTRPEAAGKVLQMLGEPVCQREYLLTGLWKGLRQPDVLPATRDEH